MYLGAIVPLTLQTYLWIPSIICINLITGNNILVYAVYMGLKDADEGWQSFLVFSGGAGDFKSR